MTRMKSNFRTRMFYNGYRWNHSTDSRGFRNQVSTGKTDVLLLGDSMIYGHGVDAESTISHHLENISGIRVYNMGQQGACMHEEYTFASEYIDELSPSHIILFFLNNDLSDLAKKLTPTEMRKFVSSPDTDFSATYIDKAQAAVHKYTTLYKFKKDIYCLRAIQVISKATKERRQHGRQETTGHAIASTLPIVRVSHSNRAQPQIPKTVNDNRLPMEFTRKGLTKLHLRCKNAGIHFTFAYIHTGQPGDDEYERELATHCKSNDISYINLKTILAGSPTFFLENDGHFSDAGANAVAGHLAEKLGIPTPFANQQQE